MTNYWDWLPAETKFYIQLLTEMQTLNKTLASIDQSLMVIAKRLPDPGPITLNVTGEPMSNILTFDIQLPTWPEGQDIASGELTMLVDGVDPKVVGVPLNQPTVTGLQAPQDSTVDLSFVYIDDAGNRSQTPSTLSQKLTDTLPPPNPGSLGIVVTGESS